MKASRELVYKLLARHRPLSVVRRYPLSRNLASRWIVSLPDNPESLQGKWRESTAELLNHEDIALGSFDTLKVHLTETLILFWAEREQGVEGITKCFQLLDRLVDESIHNSNEKINISIHIIHAILKGWNNLFKKGRIDLLPSKVLEKIDTYTSKSDCFEPNIATFTIILNGASHCPNPKERLEFTEMLLLRLIHESEKNPEVCPTTVTFSTVINAWARSATPTAATRAEKLLELAQKLHSDGWRDLEPNSIMYTSVINAWAKAGNPHRAELLLKKMYEDFTLNGNSKVKPNLWTFNTVLAAWSKSSKSSAVESAEALLRQMIDLNKQGILDSRPDTISYNCLLHTLARRRKTYTEASQKAESLVQEMLDNSNASSKDDSILPNEITYTALFKIFAACDSIDKQEKAKFWVEKIHDKRILNDSFVRDQLKQLGWTHIQNST